MFKIIYNTEKWGTMYTSQWASAGLKSYVPAPPLVEGIDGDYLIKHLVRLPYGTDPNRPRMIVLITEDQGEPGRIFALADHFMLTVGDELRAIAEADTVASVAEQLLSVENECELLDRFDKKREINKQYGWKSKFWRWTWIAAGIYGFLFFVGAGVWLFQSDYRGTDQTALSKRIGEMSNELRDLRDRYEENRRDVDVIANELRVVELRIDDLAGDAETVKGDRISVAFVEPAAGEQVPQFIDVRYTLKGALPSGFRPVLVIRDPLGQWWSWGSSKRGVHTGVQIGVGMDAGKFFELRVIVTDAEFPMAQPRRSLPKAIHSDSVTVIRK